jgi:hypothetical protein
MRKILFVLAMFISSVTIAQKAYQVIKYKAATNRLGIVDLNYADGYFLATEIVVTAKNGKKIKFIYAPEGSTNNRQFFVLFDNNQRRNNIYFKLKFNPNKVPPRSISGILHGEDGNDYTITFMKQS